MAHRKNLFGYKMRKGTMVIVPAEAKTVERIFELYASGESLADITKALCLDNVPYSTEAGWNKMCVKRIIENPKYIGTEIYPRIISDDVFKEAEKMRLYKNKEYGYRKSQYKPDTAHQTITLMINNSQPKEIPSTLEEVYMAAQVRYEEIIFTQTEVS